MHDRLLRQLRAAALFSPLATAAASLFFIFAIAPKELKSIAL
jgi:hypothetical protein